MLVSTTTSGNSSQLDSIVKRRSSQPIMPQQLAKRSGARDGYLVFPSQDLGSGKIFSGYKSLGAWIAKHPAVIIDGYSGVFWENLRESLSGYFSSCNLNVRWLDVRSAMKSEEEINRIIQPFVGPADSLWGRKCDYELEDFFKPAELSLLTKDENYTLTIVFGTGAALVNWQDVPVVYLDVPKNEIQYRMRAGSITNLGCNQPARASEMYKRFYFVDWVVLNRHKKKLLNKAAVFADVQWLDSLNWMFADALYEAFNILKKSVFRVRPWFEAGAWGGQWMKHQFSGLNKQEVNYAWSFELIVPENGIVLESDGNLLELSFDCLMFADNKAIIGKHAAFFEDEFPIRFDFLDTWDGGNLSIQCHPSLSYIRETFGEKITQDETYYILDCKEDAKVYLGFQENIEPREFRAVLENSRNNNEVVAVEEYVQAIPASKHDLFLIPNGTVHSAGANNLVLEISATPYIFTFKMYDWLRLDLNGEPRAINIEHAFNNLNFKRKGGVVQQELIAAPVVIEEGKDWQLVHLPTHAEHLYDVHRIEFDSNVLIHTGGSCHVLMLVEGTSICVSTPDGKESVYHYAETFVVPAAAEAYSVFNLGKKRARLVKAFIKDNIDFLK